MYRVLNYVSRYQSFRGGLAGLPGFARLIVLLFALPGILLAGLSIFALLVSILALLLLTVPVYRLLRWICVGRSDREAPFAEEVVQETYVEQPGPRRQIDVRIVE